jgi:DNA repair exonuclease SbcCD ATPase subunit/DNA repair exonuclease SbcCD nuclease subunit
MADIHLRNGDLDRSRYDEYQHVFENTIGALDRLECVQEHRALIVLAGDVFHHKGKMDTPALKLFFWWMDRLLARAPVVVICGNHDFRQEDPRHPDMLETMTAAYQHKQTRHPLMYLKETGQYTYDSLGFGVVSVKDTLKAGNTSGIVRTLPSFPSADQFEETITHKLALFHGTIKQSALPNEQRLSEMNGYPLEWFTGYDMVLLGDNHKQQHHASPMPWGYPGSLVQQDFGEPTFGHGLLLWDLSTRIPETIHIPNHHGMITVKWSDKEKDFLVAFGKRDYAPIAKAVQRPHFPRTPRVRVLGTVGEEQKVRALLETYDIKPSYIFATTSLDPTQELLGDACSDMEGKLTQLSDLNDPHQWVEYLQRTTPESHPRTEWILSPDSLKLRLSDAVKEMLPPDIVQKVTDRNHRIQKALDEYYEQLQGTHTQHRIVLKHMYWDYAMCYGHNNYFDFENIQGCIALLNGKNASGKSSFLDVLCIGLYGEPTKHRNMLSGKKMTAKMIHDQRPVHKHLMRVNILFEMNGDLYEISRSFTTQKKEEHGTYAQLHSAQVCAVTATRDAKRMLCEGAVMVDHWVGKHFGELDDMLMSTIVCQMDLTNFFYMKQEEQKKILDHALHLGSIAAFAKVLKEASLAYHDWLAHLKTSIQTLESAKQSVVRLEDVTEQYEELARLKAVLKELQEVQQSARADLGNVEELPELDAKEAKKRAAKLQAKLVAYQEVELSERAAFIYEDHLSKVDALRTQLRVLEPVHLEKERVTEEVMALEREETELRDSDSPPQLSRAKLEVMQSSMQTWRDTYPKEWFECTDDALMYLEELKERHTTLQQRLRDLTSSAVAKPAAYEVQENAPHNGVESESPPCPLRPQDGYAAWKAEWKEWVTTTRDVGDETVEELQKSVDDYEQFLQTWKRKHEERETITKEVHSMKEELQELDSIPNNPECWACQQQPFLHRKSRLKEQQGKYKKFLIRIEKYLAQCEDGSTMEEHMEELARLKERLHAREYYERHVSRMEAEHNAWKQAREQWCALEAWQRVTHARACWAWQTWNASLQEAQQAYLACTAELEPLQAFATEFYAKESEMHFLQEEEERHACHNEWKKRWEALCIRKEELENAKLYWQLKEELRNSEETLAQYGESVARMVEKKKLLTELDVVERSGRYHEWKKQQHVLLQHEERYEQCKRTYILAQSAYGEYMAQKERMDVMTEFWNDLMERKKDLSVLEVKFIGDKTSGDGYKEWIYRQKVVPLVEEEVNRFLTTIETIRLRIVYEKKCFVYYLEDRGNMPTLDKASGYQNFVVGLAMRLALARIGAVGQNVRHLFIDEGFTACDVTNIEKVPMLLHGIMSYGGYESILLMSHLEQVQEAAQRRIDIERAGMFSFIRWGTSYPTLEKLEPEVTAVKKRGRPKKITSDAPV